MLERSAAPLDLQQILQLKDEIQQRWQLLPNEHQVSLGLQFLRELLVQDAGEEQAEALPPAAQATAVDRPTSPIQTDESPSAATLKSGVDPATMLNEADCAPAPEPEPPTTRSAVYATGWAGQRTFEQIYEELVPNVNRLLRYYRNAELDIPDLIAHAFMRLWIDLSADTSLLTTVDKGGALKLVLNRTNPQLYRKFYRHEMYLEDLAVRSGDPDEFVIEGFDHGHNISHATFAEAIDLRLDIEQTLTQLAEKYIDSQAHLAALYYITTAVPMQDAAALAGRSGTKLCWWLTSVVKPLREELAAKLDLHKPRQGTWQDRYRAGAQAPLRTLLERFETEGNVRMVTTLQSMAAWESCKTLSERLGLPKSHIHYLRRIAHRELNKVYGCAA